MKLRKEYIPSGNRFDIIQDNIQRKIPRSSIILPYIKKLSIPDFSNENTRTYTLTTSNEASETVFHKFVNRVIEKKGVEFFPIIRISDGEYELLFGKKPPLFDGKLFRFIKSYFHYIIEKIFRPNIFEAKTLPNVSSGLYSKTEIKFFEERIHKGIKLTSKKGLLALHLTYTPKAFQERFHKALSDFLRSQNIVLNNENYVPFYFVYALIMGPKSEQILSGSNILLIHSAKGKKKMSIERTLFSKNVKSIQWINISSERSLLDDINLSSIHNIDICFIGAGVGKLHLVTQLIGLNAPVIDAGYCFEVWANDQNRKKRPMMSPD